MALPIPVSKTPHEVSRATAFFFTHSPLRLNYFNRLNSLSFRNLHRPQSRVQKGNGDSGNASANGNFVIGDDSYPDSAVRNVDNDNVNIWEEIEYVEVIAIGSRKDAVLDFCLNSPSLSPALRFW